MVSLFQKPPLSKVNARHLLDDLASSYSYSLEEAVLVEMIANSLDARSTNIHISLNVDDGTLTIEDGGGGMSQDDFEKYHDLAESRKERGRGIGFAGLGAKLAHKVAHKVVTETRVGVYRDASEWRFKGDDLTWNHTRARTLQDNGTKVTLYLAQRWRRILRRDFVEGVIERHYGALLDPFLSKIYEWEAIYPQGVTFYTKEIDEAQEPQERHRVPKLLEQETARLLNRIPELRYLFAAPLRDRVASPDPSGDTPATLVDLAQFTRGLEAGGGGGEGVAVFPVVEEGQAPMPQDDGQVPTRLRPRSIRGGPHIERGPIAKRDQLGRRRLCECQHSSSGIYQSRPTAPPALS